MSRSLLLLLAACGGPTLPDDTGAPDTDAADTDAGAETDPPDDTDTPTSACGAASWSWGAVNTVGDADASYQGEGVDYATQLRVAGDVDGDSADDLLIGTAYADHLAADAGAVYFVTGAKARTLGQSLATVPSYVGEVAGAGLSGGVSVGDVDGDGLADVSLGAGYGPANSTQYLVLGKASGWASQTPASSADVVLHDDWIEGYYADGGVGPVGDVDGDGTDDWVLTHSVDGDGEIHVVPVGSSATELHLPDDSALWVRDDGDEMRLLDWGDLDADGVVDLVAFRREATPPRVDVVYGGGSLPWDVALADATQATFEITAWPAVVADVSGDGAAEIVDNTYWDGVWLHFGARWTGSTRTAADAEVHIGPGETVTDVTHLGDIDGDGLGDLGIRRWVDREGASDLYVFFGRDAWPTELALADADVVMQLPSTMSGQLQHLGGGDFDGDGLRDVVLGSWYEAVDAVPRAGIAWIVRGRSEWPATLSLEDADAAFAGDVKHQTLGAYAAIGDFDGDGCDDLATASHEHPTAGVGETFVFYGQGAP